MEFEHIPSLVDLVQDGNLPSAEEWGASIAKLDACIKGLEAEMAELEQNIPPYPRSVASPAQDRKRLEDRLRTARDKRDLWAAALAVGLVSASPSEVDCIGSSPQFVSSRE